MVRPRRWYRTATRQQGHNHRGLRRAVGKLTGFLSHGGGFILLHFREVMETQMIERQGLRKAIAMAAVMLFVGLSGLEHARAEEDALFVTSPSQPLNVGDAMIAAAAYHDS